jgi:hypothetical protein
MFFGSFMKQERKTRTLKAKGAGTQKRKEDESKMEITLGF